MAQISDIYQLAYFANRNNASGFDQVVNIVNPGAQGSPMSSSEGLVCANIYVFAPDQQMIACCACPITADGLLSLSVNKNLTGNPLTGVAPNAGAIALVSSAPEESLCDPTAISIDNVEPDLRAWSTHLVQATPGTLFTIETGFRQAPLGQDELSSSFLPSTCRFTEYLGSGKGVCSCGSI
jgi:hypothetical protein